MYARSQGGQFLSDHHGLDRTAVAAADRLGQRRSQDAELLGEGPQTLRLPASAGLESRRTAALQGVAGIEELARAVAQQFLFGAQIGKSTVFPWSQGRFGQDVALNLVAARID